MDPELDQLLQEYEGPMPTHFSPSGPVGIDDMILLAFELRQEEPLSLFASNLTSNAPLRYGSYRPTDIPGLLNLPSVVGSLTSPQSFSMARLPLKVKALSKAEKSQKRKENHNEVERRRRVHIKNGIEELSTLVPPAMLRFTEEGNPVKPNKARTLCKTVEYIKELERIIKVQNEQREKLAFVIKKLS